MGLQVGTCTPIRLAHWVESKDKSKLNFTGRDQYLTLNFNICPWRSFVPFKVCSTQATSLPPEKFGVVAYCLAGDPLHSDGTLKGMVCTENSGGPLERPQRT